MSANIYYQLDALLTASNVSNRAAECQGILCGMLCSHRQEDLQNWVAHSLGDEAEKLSKQCLSLLEDLRIQTESHFGKDSGGVDLLLPNDNDPIYDKLSALVEWNEGFLFGIGLSGIGTLKHLPDVAQEFLNDVKEISQLDTLSEDEENEHFYTELVEYLRVGILVFREEIHASPMFSHATSSKH